MSFSPLFAILLVKFYLEMKENNAELSNHISLMLPILVLTLVPWVRWGFSFTHSLCKKVSVSEKITSVETLGDTYISYIMTYLVPYTTLSYNSKPSTMIANGLLFVIIMNIIYSPRSFLPEPDYTFIRVQYFQNMFGWLSKICVYKK